MEALLTHEVDTNNRLRVYLDYNYTPLRDTIDEMLGVATIRIDRQYGEITSVLDERVDKAIQHFTNAFHYFSHTNYEQLRERAIGLYLNLIGYTYEFVTLRGHSQSDWADVVIYREIGDDNYFQYDKKILNAWFAGDIYMIAHETRKTYTNDNDPNDTIEKWESVDMIGSIIDYDIENTIVDYLQNFDL